MPLEYRRLALHSAYRLSRGETMTDLNRDQAEYAVNRLKQLVDYRDMTQMNLEALSGIKQSKVSKILTRACLPSEDELTRLFKALGLRLKDVLNETEGPTKELLGYLASPLTGLTERADEELHRVISRIRDAASAEHFGSPPFSIYWPGDYTHPRRNPGLSAEHVYVTDRSRASAFDFVIMLCASPSFGVGQENEIATQAGVPAIRLIPQGGISRMMLGSFIHSIDVEYQGSLETAITLRANGLEEALGVIRRLHFRHRALYRNQSADSFAERVAKLVNERRGDYQSLAEDLGVNLSYLHRMMQEPLVVSNPSACLLTRLAILLDVSVAYLIGESDETDPAWLESNSAWRRWVDAAGGLDAALSLKLRDEWRHDYSTMKREQISPSSLRASVGPMKERDWQLAYDKALKQEGENETRLFPR